MRTIALAALTAIGVGFVGVSGVSAAPVSAPAIEQAARAGSAVTKTRCWIHRWCGPQKCHRRFWCR
jgi:hypothetical protein